MGSGLYRLFLAAALLLPLVARADVITLKLAHPAPPSSSFQTAAELYDANLQKLSGGSMRLEIIAGGVLGNIPQTWAQLRAGSLDMTLQDLAAVSAMSEAKSFRILNAPYLFRDADHYDKFLASPVYADMVSELEKAAGIKFIGYLDHRPPRALSTGKVAVRNINDMKGLKVRTPEVASITDAFKAFGASPTPIKASELYLAMQTGLVDGQDNGIVDVVAAGYTEVQHYYSPIDYLYSGVVIAMSGKRWASMTAQQKGWLEQAAAETRKTLVAAYQESVNDAYSKAKAKGMVILDVDKSGFQKIGAQLIQTQDGVDWPKGLAASIQAIH
jgi:TRAP-type transport system periplasmic protein